MSCQTQQSGEIHAPNVAARSGITEVARPDSERVVAGQTLYVPAYTSIYIADRAERFNLAITLSVRNADPSHPIVVTGVRYYDQDGRLIHDHLKKPLRIAPMAATEFFVKESDTTGGVSVSFLIEWAAEQSVTPPVVESIMVGTASTQGISFVCPARVVEERGRAGSHPESR
jgi:hypothetical protein